MWSQVNGEHAGAARRRRERRLRQLLRHERLSVAMALAESLHSGRPHGEILPPEVAFREEDEGGGGGGEESRGGEA